MSEPNAKSESKLHRVDGRLHLVHYVTDENGEKIATLTLPLKVEFRLEDVAQLAAGACVMGLPAANRFPMQHPGSPFGGPSRSERYDPGAGIRSVELNGMVLLNISMRWGTWPSRRMCRY